MLRKELEQKLCVLNLQSLVGLSDLFLTYPPTNTQNGLLFGMVLKPERPYN